MSLRALRGESLITPNESATLVFREVMLAPDLALEDRILKWYNCHKLVYYKTPMSVM